MTTHLQDAILPALEGEDDARLRCRLNDEGVFLGDTDAHDESVHATR